MYLIARHEFYHAPEFCICKMCDLNEWMSQMEFRLAAENCASRYQTELKQKNNQQENKTYVKNGGKLYSHGQLKSAIFH